MTPQSQQAETLNPSPRRGIVATALVALCSLVLAACGSGQQEPSANLADGKLARAVLRAPGPSPVRQEHPEWMYVGTEGQPIEFFDTNSHPLRFGHPDLGWEYVSSYNGNRGAICEASYFGVTRPTTELVLVCEMYVPGGVWPADTGSGGGSGSGSGGTDPGAGGGSGGGSDTGTGTGSGGGTATQSPVPQTNPYWFYVQSEGSAISIPDGESRSLRFGHPDHEWLYLNTYNGNVGVTCSVSYFYGMDPAPGVAKVCEVFSADGQAPPWISTSGGGTGTGGSGTGDTGTGGTGTGGTGTGGTGTGGSGGTTPPATNTSFNGLAVPGSTLAAPSMATMPSGTGPADFALTVNGVAMSAPHIIRPGQVIGVRAVMQNSVRAVIDWGDGQSNYLAQGWRANTPTADITHAYQSPGTYRIEYIVELPDGAWMSRTLPVAVQPDAPLAVVPDGCASTVPTRRVLFVGNSQIAVQNVPRIVASIADSAPAGCPRLETDSVTMGGANLADIWGAGDVQTALRSGRYDTVVIAESIDLGAAWLQTYPTAFFDPAGAMADLAQSLGIRVIMYATPTIKWDYTNAEVAAMTTYNAAMARARGYTLAAGGMAWMQALNLQPSLGLYYSDDAHASYMGATLSSFVLYAAITGASPVGLAASPITNGCDPTCEPIEPTLAYWLQQVAWMTYLNTR